MPLITTGLNHLTAPVGLRELVAFTPENTQQAVATLNAQAGIEEALILSTCNRTELLCTVAAGAEEQPVEWLYRHHGLTPGKLDEFLYHFAEEDSVRHLFRVATGLDSMVLGEPQILGQVKEAWQLARAAETLGQPLDRLMQHTFNMAKRVRTDTRIGAHSVSVALTAIRLAEQVFSELENACVLLIGAGDTIELAARHLAEKHVRRLIVANRNIEHAQVLAARHGGYAVALADLARHLPEADIVISSTSAREPIVSRAVVETAIAARRNQPMFIVDIAVPRDVEASVADLDHVFLYGIDDLQQVIDENLRSRQIAAGEANAIIDLHVEHYMAWRRALTLHNPAPAIRRNAETMRDEVLARARDMLARGKTVEDALDYLAHALTNKLMHAPSANLREATLLGDVDMLKAACRLYGLTDDHDEPPA